MEREISVVTMLGVTLVIAAAVTWLVIGTTQLGMSMRDMTYDKTITIKTNMESSEIHGLMWSETNLIPRASLYYILAKEDGSVKSINYMNDTCKIGTSGKWVNSNNTKSKVNSYDIIVSDDGNLTGKVIVDVTYNNSFGMYDLTITEPNN